MNHDTHVYHDCVIFIIYVDFVMSWLSFVTHGRSRKCHQNCFDITMVIVMFGQNTLKLYDIMRGARIVTNPQLL